MSERVHGRIRFISEEAFDEWKKSWANGPNRYEFPEEFETLSDCKWRSASIDGFQNAVCIWEIFSNVTGDAIETDRIAVLIDEMKYVEFDVPDYFEENKETDIQIANIVEQLNSLKEELRMIASSGKRLTFEQYSQIKEIIGE